MIFGMLLGFKKFFDAIFGKNIQKHIGQYPFILEVSLWKNEDFVHVHPYL